MHRDRVIRWRLPAGLMSLFAMPGMLSAQSAEPSKAPCDESQSEPIFSEIGSSDEEVEAFLAALQKAVASDDRPKVASMIRYPIAAWTEGRDVTFKTTEALLASYEVVFTARLKKTIAEARKECLFANWQGAMIHDGEIWFRALSKGRLKIVKINGPIGEEQ